MAIICIVLVLVVLGLIICPGTATVNLIFNNEEMSWVEAARTCFINGGVLESDIDQIHMHLKDNIQDTSIWLGQYLTKWRAEWGCYSLNGTTETFEVKRFDVSKCQTLCARADYFSVKDTTCVCIGDIDNNTKENFNKCSCETCFHVMKHNIYTSGRDDEDGMCLAANCEENMLKRMPEDCRAKLYLICDNGHLFVHNYTDGKQAEECFRRSSFIKWYDACGDLPGPNKKALHWTSANRSEQRLNIIQKDEIMNIEPSSCSEWKQSNVKFTSDCSQRRSFVCRFTRVNQEKVTPSKVITAGVIPSISITVGIILFAIFIYKKKFSLKRKPHFTNADTNPTASPQDNQHRNTTFTNPHYSLAQPIEPEIEISNGNRDYDNAYLKETVKGVHLNKIEKKEGNDACFVNDSINTARLQQNLYSYAADSDQTNSNYVEIDINYELPSKNNPSEKGGMRADDIKMYNYSSKIEFEEDSDEYSLNDDYDHLHNVRKKENLDCNVYDHLPASKEPKTIFLYDPTHSKSFTGCVHLNEES